jgi:hypothetical protein
MAIPARGITPGLPTNTGSFKGRERGSVQLRLVDTGPLRDIGPDALDIFDRGSMTRGVVNHEKRVSLDEWDDWARAQWKDSGDPRFEEFRGGMAAAQVALMAHSVRESAQNGHAHDPQTVITRWQEDGTVDFVTANRAYTILGKNRANADDRKFWLDQVKHAPSSAAQNGYMAAAAIMSGYEQQWNLDTDRDETALRGWADSTGDGRLKPVRISINGGILPDYGHLDESSHLEWGAREVRDIGPGDRVSWKGELHVVEDSHSNGHTTWLEFADGTEVAASGKAKIDVLQTAYDPNDVATWPVADRRG